MTPELRLLKPVEWSSWHRTLARAFATSESEGIDLWRPVTEFDRALCAWDGPDLVGTSNSYSLRTTVPGGASVPTGGLSMVSVAPTHRRRGLLRDMLRWQLDDTRRRGEPLAALTASEPGIYGRFGYGLASHWLTVSVDTGRVRVAVPPEAAGLRLRLVDPTEALAECEAVYARALPTRPGRLERSEEWARIQLHDPPGERAGGTELQCVLAERDGRTVGYARYSVQGHWVHSNAEGRVRVRELEADDAATGAALWQHLAGIDLTSEVTADKRPPDDPVAHLVSDVRRARLRLRDSLFVRPVELGPALAARTYQLPLDTVLQVTDDFCPWNTGRWRLSGDSAGAVCERTEDAAELSLSVVELGAAYLGGTSLRSLADAGRVQELRAGALDPVSVAFGAARAPFLPHGF
ncbi:GNAT family N-acetyltransferase [Streptomyces sp. XM4193]|uniref:GNAT family N-acetyltransferase n=1 Tax=Streptomyces sp. XM4193 TaxID=2929782 RepID=UPI001FF9D02A|nr:GNAT family N-acetyltransferase [Streptomyces sp. XM4193]MCK1795840.1 GNAT family N-acetyltransferase [Streptomyces sp. XM4193]